MNACVVNHMLVLVTFVQLTTVSAVWSDWTNTIPTNCPPTDTISHTCSVIETRDSMCSTPDTCCEDDSDSSDDDDCWTCYKNKPCTQYSCHTECCIGYREIEDGQCEPVSSPIPCENGGTAITDDYINWACICPPEYRGFSCEKLYCGCENEGECTLKDNKTFCECPAGFSGDMCQTVDCNCQNNGRCTVRRGAPFCICPRGFVGDTCETEATSSPQNTPGNGVQAHQKENSEASEQEMPSEDEESDKMYTVTLAVIGLAGGIIVLALIMLVVRQRMPFRSKEMKVKQGQVEDTITISAQAPSAEPMLPHDEHVNETESSRGASNPAYKYSQRSTFGTIYDNTKYAEQSV